MDVCHVGGGRNNTDRNKDLMKEGENSILQRLKICYIHGFNSNPQFLLCKHGLLNNASMISTISSVVLVQAVLRSLYFKDLKFCGGVSDYRWSMWLMVVVQVLTIVVVTVAIGLRWLPFTSSALENFQEIKKNPHPYLQFLHLFSLLNVPKWLEVSFRYVIYYPLRNIEYVLVSLLSIVVTLILTLIRFIASCILCTFKEANETYTMEFKDLLGSLKARKVEVQERVLTKAVEDMERWMKRNKSGCPELLKLLSEVPPWQESLETALNNAGTQLSCLHMLLLVEIAKLSTSPSSLHVSLTKAFDEVFEIIHFIDSKRNVGSGEHTLRSMSAKVIWKFGFPEEVIKKQEVERIMNETVPRVVIHEPDPDEFRCDSFLAEIYKNLPKFFPKYVHGDASNIVDFISRGTYSTTEQLHYNIQRVFVGMLNVFLPQLPDAIFKHIVESPIEEYEKRVRFSLGLICKLESLESYMRLSFPAGSNITCLIHTQLSAPDTIKEGKASVTTTVAPVIKDVGHEIEAIGQTTHFGSLK